MLEEVPDVVIPGRVFLHAMNVYYLGTGQDAPFKPDRAVVLIRGLYRVGCYVQELVVDVVCRFGLHQGICALFLLAACVLAMSLFYPMCNQNIKSPSQVSCM